MRSGATPTREAGIPLLDLQAQYRSIKPEIDAAVERVIESQRFILGPEVEALEAEIAAYSGCAYAIGVSSGSDALLVALMALGIRPGDEVITSAYSFFATAGAVARLGARPVFVDIDPLTFNLNPAEVDAVITERTRAIIPVHLFGQMAEMNAIMAAAQRHGVSVVEDAAQAIGSEHRGRRAGSIGNVGCFSFFPTKNLGGFGDGGMVTTNDGEIAARVRLLRNHGASPKYDHLAVGGNFRLDALQAAVLRVKLTHLDDWTRGRQANAATYCRLMQEAGVVGAAETVWCLDRGCRSSNCELEPSRVLVLPAEAPDKRHIYNQFVVRTGRRGQLVDWLTQRGIGTEIYYPRPLHLQQCFSALNYRAGNLPASECAARTSLALPIYPELTEEMISSVVAAISGFFLDEAC